MRSSDAVLKAEAVDYAAALIAYPPERAALDAGDALDLLIDVVR
jgi:hypothetical protein